MTLQVRRRGADPVFVDGTGRRRRLFVIAGAAGGLVLVLLVLALLAGFTGAGPGSLPGWPGADAGQVRGAGPRPDPSGGAQSAAPRARPAASATRVPPSNTTQAVGATTGATPAMTSPTATNSHRTLPTQTPTAHPSKKH